MQGLARYYKAWVDDDITNPEQYFTLRLCYSKKYVVKKMDKDSATLHRKQLLAICPKALITLFDSGSIHFPYEERFTILQHIAFDISANTPMCFNQIGFEELGMRFVIDVDSDRLLSEEEIVKFQNVLLVTCQQYYPNREIPIRIGTAICGPRMKRAQLSTAIHFVVHIKVSVAEGQQLTYAYNLRMRADKSINMQDITIDAGIYKSGSKQVSMRMIYSSKLDTCMLCNNDTFERQACELCKSRGMIVSLFSYIPRMFTVDGVDRFKETNASFEAMVVNFSIWSDPKDIREDYKKPELDPVVPEESKKRKPEPNAVQKQTTKLFSNACFDALEEEIQKVQIGGDWVWKDLVVSDIKKYASTAGVFVDGIGSTICLYANKDHGGRKIWFSLSKKAVMTMRCGSEKHGCDKMHKDNPIQFSIPQRIANDVFGIPNVPSFDSEERNDLSAKKSQKPNQRTNDLCRHLANVYKLPAPKK